MKAKALTKAMGPEGTFCFNPGDVIEIDEKDFETLFLAGAIEPIESDAEVEEISAPTEQAQAREQTSSQDTPDDEPSAEKPKPKRGRKSS